MLFTRGVSGARVVTGQQDKEVEGHLFSGWGSHSPSMAGRPYLTAAAAVGMGPGEAAAFADKLDKALAEAKKKKKGKSSTGGKE